MNAINKILLFIAIASLQLHCNSALTPGKYLEYFEKNRANFTAKIVRGGVTATVAYVPNEYYAARIMQFDSTISLADAIKRYENSIFFLLAVQNEKDKINSVLNDRNGYDGYADNVQRNTFEKDNDMFLINGRDTVKAVSAGYDRNWSMGGEDAFILGFSRKKLIKNLSAYHLVLRDITPELGTMDIAIKELVKKAKRLKG